MKKKSGLSKSALQIVYLVIILLLSCLAYIFNVVDEMTAWIVFALCIFGIHFMTVYWSPYNPKAKYMKYLTVENKALAKLFISKRNFYIDGYVKVADRKKISLLSVILYIWEALLLIITVILQIIPPIPCTPYIFRVLGRRGRGLKIVISSLNIKIPLLLASITLVAMFGGVMIWCAVELIKRKEKTTKWMRWLLILLGIACITAMAILIVGLFRN